MKKRSFRKLALSRETLYRLSERALGVARGGVDTLNQPSCNPCPESVAGYTCEESVNGYTC
ncbi:MAG TPA: hypothetical protein VGR07_21100 [Thermoanaerobaculia bacterium]|jgi:hypothetical protein|nr:hypothetical protein [Thermoanaerobaculia bacterium]